MGRAQRRALKISVDAVGGVPAGKDREPRRAQVHGRGTVIAKKGQIIVARSGGDGNDVVQVVTGRVNRIDAVVLRGVAGGGHEDDAGLAQATDGVVQCLGGKDGQIIVARSGGDGNDVVQVVTGRVNRIDAVVLRGVNPIYPASYDLDNIIS